jgi:hypothetical protein
MEHRNRTAHARKRVASIGSFMLYLVWVLDSEAGSARIRETPDLQYNVRMRDTRDLPYRGSDTNAYSSQ